jgi:site-specific DNA recombinase
LNVAVYYRVSTKEQGEDDKYGLSRQRSDVTKFLKANAGYEVVREFEDSGRSGTMNELDRPGLREMLSAKGFDAIIVPSWDRLARDSDLSAHLRVIFARRKIEILSATESKARDPIDKLTLQILASISEYERTLITKRMHGGRIAKAEQGGYAHGQPPYGTKAIRGSKSLHLDPLEYAVLQELRTLRAAGLSLRGIAAALNDKNVLSRTGRAWSHVTVTGALRTADRVDAIAESVTT